MIIRRATLKDCYDIAEVHVKSWKETYKGLVNQEYLDNLRVADRIGIWENALSIQVNVTAPVFLAENKDGGKHCFCLFWT